jgi:hypothetical protein
VTAILISFGIFLSLGHKVYINKDSVRKEIKIVNGNTWNFHTFKYSYDNIEYQFGYYDFEVCGTHPDDKMSRISYNIDKYLEKGYFRKVISDGRIVLIVLYWFAFVLLVPWLLPIIFTDTYESRYKEYKDCSLKYAGPNLGPCALCKHSLYCKHTKFDTPLNKLTAYWKIFLGYSAD